jgi:hypothetical protein
MFFGCAVLLTMTRLRSAARLFCNKASRLSSPKAALPFRESNEAAKAIAYSLDQWRGLIRFLDDGRVGMSNNAAERGSARPDAEDWAQSGSRLALARASPALTPRAATWHDSQTHRNQLVAAPTARKCPSRPRVPDASVEVRPKNANNPSLKSARS